MYRLDAAQGHPFAKASVKRVFSSIDGCIGLMLKIFRPFKETVTKLYIFKTWS
jgi:hypothetical protein